MSASTTPFLDLKLLAAAQAQKHVTHNDALMSLDALVHLAVDGVELTTPPASPDNGARYIVGAAATGAFATHDHQIAVRQDGGWVFHAPRIGWRAWSATTNTLLVYNGSVWTSITADSTAMTHLGINASADTTNRLTVSAPATLLNHEGAGHQLKLNKAASTHTASILYQTDYSGRAEFGTTGDDHFHIKVSGDGASWKEALTIDKTSGVSSFAYPVMVGGAASGRSFQVKTTGGQAGLEASGTGIKFVSVNAAQTDEAELAIQGRPITFMLNGAEKARLDTGGNLLIGASTLYNPQGWSRCFQVTGTTGAMFSMKDNTSEYNFSSYAGQLYIAKGISNRLIFDLSGNIMAGADNAQTLGGASYRFSSVYAATGTIQTSDLRQKKDIADSALGLTFINALRPVSYKWIVGSNEVSEVEDGTEMFEAAPAYTDEAGVAHPARMETRVKYRKLITAKPGKRTHYGLIAQEVQVALAGVGISDFAGYIKTDILDPDSDEGLRYDQFIAPLIKAVQELSARVSALESAA